MTIAKTLIRITNSAITQGKTHLSEGVISLFFHVLKSLVVLFINWIILNKLDNNDYVVWSITSSVLMIATASDLGIGQHTVTLFIHAKKELRKSILINACIAISPLFFLSFGFVYFSLSGTLFYVFLMALFVSFRLFSIPFGALLNATNNFQIRKIIEFVTYVIAAIAILLIVHFKKDVRLSLLALNFSFIIGSFITIFVAQKDVPNEPIVIDGSIYNSTISVLYGSLPFLVNNITSLLTYGGFIWISSFVIPDFLIAKLSVLHSFLFMTFYQVYDVFLRSKQADLILPEKIKFFLKLNMVFSFAVFIFLLSVGYFLLKIISPKLQFSIIEMLFFSIFVIVEFSYLFIQSIVQVNIRHSRSLFFFSIVRVCAIFTAFFSFFLFCEVSSLTNFFLHLSIFSFLGLIFSNYHFKSKTKLSIWG
jgi:hypothetical protein